MLDKVKWFTQRITMLLVVFLVLFVVPFILAKLFQLLGLVAWVDSFYKSSLAVFWVAFLVSRTVYGAAWVSGSYWLVQSGEQTGWFWFKPEKSYHSKDEDIDQSGMILSIVAAILACLVFSELALRGYTWTSPIWMGTSG